MAVGRLVGWLVGVLVCASLVLCAGNQGLSSLQDLYGPAKYRPVSRGSYYLEFNYFHLVSLMSRLKFSYTIPALRILYK